MKTLLVVALIGVLAGTVLGIAHSLTNKRIEANRQVAALQQLEDLVPTTDQAELCREGIRLAVLEESGYGGRMEVVVATKNRKTLGVRVTRHNETPGFADILDPAAWIGRFAGEGPNDVDAVSGATVTSRAVLRAVREASARSSLTDGESTDCEDVPSQTLRTEGLSDEAK